MHKVLVTGATGFIGRALATSLGAKGWEVLAMGSSDGDIADQNTFKPFAHHEVDHVFHLAGRSFVPDSWKNPHLFCQTNVLGTINVLELCNAKRIPLTYISSYVYGQPETLPIAEGSPSRPSNPYALTKRLAEEACEFYARAYDLPITVVRPFNVYGTGQADRFLIPAIVRQALGDSNEIVVKDLTPKRDYVHVDDLIAALVATLQNPVRYRVFNIGSGSSRSVQEVIGTVQELAGTRKPVVCRNEVRANELVDVVADITAAWNGLGWRPRISFQSGIDNIIRSERVKQAL